MLQICSKLLPSVAGFFPYLAIYNHENCPNVLPNIVTLEKSFHQTRTEQGRRRREVQM